MAKNKKTKAAGCCGTGALSQDAPCCRVEALITIDARGQTVLPKEVRDKAGIKAGEKLAVISFESDGKVCCISLVKADAFAGTVREMLGPMMTEIFQG